MVLLYSTSVSRCIGVAASAGGPAAAQLGGAPGAAGVLLPGTACDPGAPGLADEPTGVLDPWSAAPGSSDDPSIDPVHPPAVATPAATKTWMRDRLARMVRLLDL
jgi:hypothetical protein